MVLSLTSPLTRGENVLRAQQKLSGANAFKENYLNAPLDGIFGEATGRGCRRAKFWLGYPESKQTPVYGDKLERLITGKRPLPPTYKARRAKRLRAKRRKTFGERAFALLAKHEGLTEKPPGTNKVLFSDWYRMRGPWCAMAVTWAYVHAGSKAFARSQRYAYVPFMLIDARAGRHGLSITDTPRHGDVFAVDWGNSPFGASPYLYDHTGLFDKWQAKGSGMFRTLEGNTSSSARGSQSNGGGLFRRFRSTRTARYVFIRVGR